MRQLGQDDDFHEVLALIRGAFAYMEGRIDPPSSMERLTVADLARAAATGEVWVAGDPILGCVVLTPGADALHLGKLAVAEAAQGMGLGRRLVARAEASARALGLPAVQLQCRVELTALHGFYRGLGYAEAGRSAHPGFDRPTSVTFRKQA
ncbi:GNAT family N-acetyltransferase [Frigidibacter mobilis]|uniref:GCN5-related N-acetyltransferase n=1 Tax=Frigidibacter mobilis TaxID=1335048 RepID=A0A159YYT8_9RHOB|nr:GNAT family N-acetyltransferase [Frigidibacter mobilis]AMY67615.1 GCN5-related N-acetyltransferase [Frigidibacter mobilis]